MLLSCQAYSMICKWRWRFFIVTTATAMRQRRMNARLFVCGRYFSIAPSASRRPGISPGPLRIFRLNVWLLEVHAAPRWHGGHSLFLFRNFSDHGFRGDQQAGDRSRILQGAPHDLGRIDDALGHQVAVFAGLSVKAVRILVFVDDLADYNRAISTSVDRDLARRRLQRLADDVDTVLLVFVLRAKALERIARTQQRDTTARQDAFLDRGAGRMHRVVNAILAFFHLGLGGAADADHRDTARELGQPLLQLLAVVVGGGLLDLRLDLVDTRLDVGLLAGAVDDRGVLLVDHHLLGTAQHGDRDVLELDAEIFTNRLSAGQDSDILQHGLAAIAEARRLYRCDLETAAQLVDDERGKRLALDVFSHDQQRLGGLHHRLEQRQQLLQARQLLLVDEDIGVLHLRAHLVGIGDEVGGDIAAVELHALDHIELGLKRLRSLDRDPALVADLLHGLGKEVTNLAVAIGRNGADLGDLFVRSDLLGAGL